MKKKSTTIKQSIFKYLLILPLFLLSFCQSEFEEPIGASENKVTVDAKLLSLMKSAIQSDSDQILTQNKSDLSKGTTDDSGQCTNFLYPMTFQVYSGDDPIPVAIEINSDEELIAFIEEFTFENSAGAFTPNYEMFIYFPIVLLDTDGNETILNNLTELEGTLEMAVQACESFNDASDGSSDDGSDGSSDDGSDGESSDASDSGSDDGSDGSSGDASDGSSDDGSDGGSSDASDSGSDDGSDSSSGDGSDDGSSDGSEGGSSDASNSGSDDGSDGSSGDGSDDGSDSSSGDGSDDGSSDGSDDESEGSSEEGSEEESEDDIILESSQGGDDDDDDSGYKFCDKNNKKVYICHKGKTICVSVNAIWGHLQHHEEDFLGTCDD
ncbi:hypothetical protein [Lutimonas sp.]|uniref:hypothetical protein n=1 Tax=Lutimonas sp. TaxID=1872403 RepID=UPI003D9B331F